MASPAEPRALVSDHGGIAGHPRGLTTLFFTEMWERFSYYGMRALLLLFMVAPADKGGLGMDAKRAAAIYGLYTFSVYFTSIPGGWIADRLLGLRRAVIVGGVLIALGHYSMAREHQAAVFRRARADRARYRASEGEHRLHRRPALRDRTIRGATAASRSSTWGSTSAR